MADKEEIIVVSKWFPEHMSDDKTTLLIFQSQLNDKSMTRAEAGEIMADAIVEKIKEMGKGATPIFLAEAALNALLEGK